MASAIRPTSPSVAVQDAEQVAGLVGTGLEELEIIDVLHGIADLVIEGQGS
ncbi:hypothetical protein [Streptomyces sp. NBC_01727]|uniref:hypothetical protein n=1 Tax=Streptomyces sp. NBC_01727 TaxID=2975924 RepID=UPI002E1040F9|nr:hypothetical protein OIE76_42910 [Streptomyces sp. NBC_01727]